MAERGEVVSACGTDAIKRSSQYVHMLWIPSHLPKEKIRENYLHYLNNVL